MSTQYGKLDSGETIIPPEGWKLLEEGELIPKNHRVCVTIHIDSSGEWGGLFWESPKSRHGNDTPVVACACGCFRAFAIPAE